MDIDLHAVHSAEGPFVLSTKPSAALHGRRAPPATTTPGVANGRSPSSLVPSCASNTPRGGGSGTSDNNNNTNQKKEPKKFIVPEPKPFFAAKREPPAPPQPIAQNNACSTPALALPPHIPKGMDLRDLVASDPRTAMIVPKKTLLATTPRSASEHPAFSSVKVPDAVRTRSFLDDEEAEQKIAEHKKGLRLAELHRSVSRSNAGNNTPRACGSLSQHSARSNASAATVASTVTTNSARKQQRTANNNKKSVVASSSTELTSAELEPHDKFDLATNPTTAENEIQIFERWTLPPVLEAEKQRAASMGKRWERELMESTANYTNTGNNNNGGGAMRRLASGGIQQQVSSTVWFGKMMNSQSFDNNTTTGGEPTSPTSPNGNSNSGSQQQLQNFPPGGAFVSAHVSGPVSPDETATARVARTMFHASLCTNLVIFKRLQSVPTAELERRLQTDFLHRRQISKEDFVGFLARLFPDEAVNRREVDLLFQLLDANRNGIVETRELRSELLKFVATGKADDITFKYVSALLEGRDSLAVNAFISRQDIQNICNAVASFFAHDAEVVEAVRSLPNQFGWKHDHLARIPVAQFRDKILGDATLLSIFQAVSLEARKLRGLQLPTNNSNGSGNNNQGGGVFGAAGGAGVSSSLLSTSINPGALASLASHYAPPSIPVSIQQQQQAQQKELLRIQKEQLDAMQRKAGENGTFSLLHRPDGTSHGDSLIMTSTALEMSSTQRGVGSSSNNKGNSTTDPRRQSLSQSQLGLAPANVQAFHPPEVMGIRSNPKSNGQPSTEPVLIVANASNNGNNNSSRNQYGRRSSNNIGGGAGGGATTAVNNNNGSNIGPRTRSFGMFSESSADFADVAGESSMRSMTINDIGNSSGRASQQPGGNTTQQPSRRDSGQHHQQSAVNGNGNTNNNNRRVQIAPITTSGRRGANNNNNVGSNQRLTSITSSSVIDGIASVSAQQQQQQQQDGASPPESPTTTTILRQPITVADKFAQLDDARQRDAVENFAPRWFTKNNVLFVQTERDGQARPVFRSGATAAASAVVKK